MEIRDAKPGDRPAIRDVARRSLQASYSLEPKAIIGAIENWYDEDRVLEILDDENKYLLVAEADGRIVAFSNSVIIEDDTAEILWLHVDPDYRGKSYGEKLYEATRERLEENGATTLHGRVLADNPEGNAFYEDQGLTKVGEEQVDIDGTPHVENVYAEVEVERMEKLRLNGTSVYIDHQTTEVGSRAPFHVVYKGQKADEIYGYWCSNCESLANAMDASGRIQCVECGNERKPTRWDAAYL